MDHFLLSPKDTAMSILSFAENACDEGGRKKSETKRGTEVAEVGRFFEALQDNQDGNYGELQEAIEYMNAKQSRLLATVERKQQLRSGASDEIPRKFLKGVLVLEETISEVDNELHEASGWKDGGWSRGFLTSEGSVWIPRR